MKCPACTDADLAISERRGIEVDYCPRCRGVWLDRGELDKILERASIDTTSAAVKRTDEAHLASGLNGIRRDEPRRRKSWLDELFD